MKMQFAQCLIGAALCMVTGSAFATPSHGVSIKNFRSGSVDIYVTFEKLGDNGRNGILKWTLGKNASNTVNWDPAIEKVTAMTYENTAIKNGNVSAADCIAGGYDSSNSNCGKLGNSYEGMLAAEVHGSYDLVCNCN